MKRLLLVVIAALSVTLFGACASLSTIPAQSLSYEVVNIYTVKVVGWAEPDRYGLYLFEYPKACVEIKNTANRAGLFSIIFFFSKDYSGRDLVYLKPGETGVASYTAVLASVDFPKDKRKEYEKKTAKWDYEVTPVY